MNIPWIGNGGDQLRNWLGIFDYEADTLVFFSGGNSTNTDRNVYAWRHAAVFHWHDRGICSEHQPKSYAQTVGDRGRTN